MIDVLVPVLGRPQNAQALVQSFRAHSSAMDEITFLCSPGDSKQISACIETGERTLIAPFPPGSGDYAKKMNYGYAMTERPWIFLGADDIRFTAGWSEIALRERGSVIATNDDANAQVKKGLFGTHCLVERCYVTEQGASADGPGYLMHEGYDHNFPDRELCHLAQMRGVYSFAKNSHVPHRHPLWKTSLWDSTYRKGMKNFSQDRDLFIERSALWRYAGLNSGERMAAKRRQRDILRAR